MSAGLVVKYRQLRARLIPEQQRDRKGESFWNNTQKAAKRWPTKVITLDRSLRSAYKYILLALNDATVQ